MIQNAIIHNEEISRVSSLFKVHTCLQLKLKRAKAMQQTFTTTWRMKKYKYPFIINDSPFLMRKIINYKFHYLYPCIVRATNESEIEDKSVCEKELSKVEKPNLTEQEAKTYYATYILCRDECFERISASEAFAKKFEKFKLKEYEKLMKKRKEKEEKREEKRRKEAEKIKKQMEREEKKKEKQQKEPTVCEKELSKVEKPNLTEQEAKTYYESYIICRDECFERISMSEAFAKKFEKFKLKEYEKLMKNRKEKEEKREEKRRKEAEKMKKQMEREEEKK
ncbi:hypothetical protein T03_14192 [Trichinella britovi]|uniref:Uncharacterized protein n=1 Tax=Trichinella britovi TaxID=45882 RepID=A0A0V1CM02_TRIBR|nr:hypothetical protein T03_14192 [Trichinella britovi]